MTAIEQYLHSEVAVMKEARHNTLNGYATLSDFVLHHGHLFDLAGAVVQKYGRMKECFRNAQELALFGDIGCIYCEGYAAGVIPVLHAWLIRDGTLVETTWPTLGSQYFGLKFKKSYLAKRVLETESYHSLIDDWENRWPLTKADPEIWRA